MTTFFSRRTLALAAVLAVPLGAQAQYATINGVSQPPGQFTITCTDFPLPGPEQICAISPAPSSVPGTTISGNCGSRVRMPDDPARPNTWLFQVGPRPANPPTANCNLVVTAGGFGPGAVNAAAIPTLSEWALLVMSLMAAGAGFVALRGRKSI